MVVKKLQKNEGFTLIELLIVVAIIGIIAAIRGSRVAPRPYVGQRDVGHRRPSRHQHGRGQLLVSVR
jgi:prepilin-type N-terminal cleavage/methylation domain-containing protein